MDDKTGCAGGDSSFGDLDLIARGGFAAGEGEAHGPGGYDVRRFFSESGDADVQVFPVNGEWVKPERADTVDMLLVGAGAGGAADGADGENGQMVMRTFRVDDLPDRVLVEVGKGGRGGTGGERSGGDGANGLVVVTTHLRPPPPLVQEEHGRYGAVS